jgi:hypothetical protein
VAQAPGRTNARTHVVCGLWSLLRCICIPHLPSQPRHGADPRRRRRWIHWVPKPVNGVAWCGNLGIHARVEGVVFWALWLEDGMGWDGVSE